MSNQRTQQLDQVDSLTSGYFVPVAHPTYLTAVVTGATQANPVVITASSHGFSTGDEVYLTGLGGMTELNGRTFTITVLDANSFSLDGEDGTGHTAYTSGGTAVRGRLQYALVSALVTAGGGGGGVSDHGGLTGLGDDDHTQYALLAGRSGGQTIVGGTAAGENLTLESTSHATKGKVNLGESVEVSAADGVTRIGTGAFVGGSAADDSGIEMTNPASLIRSGVFTEVNGQVLSAGINVGQSGGRVTTVNGGIFRFDTRTGFPFFYVVRYTTSNAEAFDFIHSLQTGEMRLGGNDLTNSFAGQLDLRSGAAARKGLVVRGAASQSASLQEWQDSSQNVKSKIDAAGDVVFNSYTDAARPAAGTAGRVIFNSDDGNLNIDTGSGWILPDGTAT